MKKRRRLWLRLVAGFILAMVIGIFVLFGTPWGLSLVRMGLEYGTNRAIPGSMQIGHLDSFGWFHPALRELEFFDPDGKRVIFVERTQVKLDVLEMFSGKVGFDMAEASGGEIIIEMKPGRGVTIESAFVTKEKKASKEPKISLQLDNVHFEDLKVVLRLKGETKFIINHVQGFMRIWRHDTPGVRVLLSQVKGRFSKPKILGNDIELRQLNGWVHGKETHVVSMKLKTRINNGGIDIDLDYFKRKEEPVLLDVRTEVGSAAKLAGVVLAIRSQFTEKMEADVERGKEK